MNVDVQNAILDVGMASSPLKALQKFQYHHSLLKDWRIIYAAVDDNGPFKLRRQKFSEKGFVSTLFRGRSLWVLDHETATTGPVGLRMGTATFVDSNVASFIQRLAYREAPSAQLLEFCKSMSEYFTLEELSNINPYLYLWEAQRDKGVKTVTGVRQTMAALHAIKLIQKPLDLNWGMTFRNIHREEAEAHADQFLMQFYREMDHTGKHIENQVDLMEAMLIRTKILEYSSQKSAQAKMKALVEFMHVELSTLMLRELIVCADILCRDGKSQLSQKLNSLHDQREPLTTIRNCAWDLHLLRSMDGMSNTFNDASLGEFYVANLITFDRDLADTLQLAGLRAFAMHRASSMYFPIYDEHFDSWLGTRVGEKRLSGLYDILSEEAVKVRAGKRSLSCIKEVLEKDRHELVRLLAHK
nr:hypothetical protein [Comamonas thiooxydans]